MVEMQPSKPAGKLYPLLFAVSAPAIIFMVTAIALCQNYPYSDDYDAGLGFANQLVQLHGFHDRFWYFLAAQHNEYKIFLGHGCVWIELALLGRVNFFLLAIFGDLFVPLLGFVLWKMFLPGTELKRRLALFAPVPLLLFQYEYWQTINWPLPGLQNLAIIPFAFLSFYLLALKTRPSYAGAMTCMLLGIAASGNGFIISAVGALVLLLQRAWFRLAAWMLLVVASIAIYAYHYDSMATQSPGHQPLSYVLLHPHFLYLLSFLGSAAGITSRRLLIAASSLLGFTLCVFFLWAVRGGFTRRDPVPSYCLLFILLTAIGVSGLRSGFGVAQSIGSRYQIYSDLLLIFAWFALARLLNLSATGRLSANPIYRAAVACSLIFFLGGFTVGLRQLLSRDRVVQRGIVNFRQAGGALSPTINDPAIPRSSDFFERSRTSLLESERLGVYEP